MARVRLIFVILALATITLIMAPLQWVAIKLNLGLARKLPMWWHKIAVWLVGMRVRVSGNIPVQRPLMLVSNHISWVDIPVLGSVMELSFIAKSEVNEMPGANLLSRLQRTIYVVREQKRKAGEQAQEVTRRMLEGDAIVLFGEGTTHDGNRIGEFKSALMGAAQYALKEDAVDSVLIQPVSIAYTHLHGMPMGRYVRAQAAWYGDMKLGGHAINIMLQGAWDVEVIFGEPVVFDENSNRRQVTKQIQAEVRNNFLNTLHRRHNEVAKAD
jgi:1-acyl-sn-glycerol-3-phosphate acyltransferase